MAEAPKIEKRVSGHLISVALRSDGLLQMEVEDHYHGTLAATKDAISLIGQVAGDKIYPILIISAKDASVDTESMNYIAQKKAVPFSNAVAFVVSSLSQKLLGNFYLSFNRPEKPTRIFTKTEEAVKWLYSYRK